MWSEQNRFPQQVPPPPPRHKRWGGCWSGLSCFGTQKGGKRVVPSSRIQEANTLGIQPNGPQALGLNNQNTTLHPSILAPPSSPVSFSNSALQSTAQSPNCFLSANSPGGPSSTMFATGPYAHETQLVSPPVFSTFTTEPSTAPFTPPPELGHITTPSSPEVPYALFFSSSMDPSAPQELQHPRSESIRNFGLDTANASKLSQDSNFFCPDTFAQFYLDQSSFSQSVGRLSVSKESDVCSNGGTVHQNRLNKASKQDVEEVEAYRASFGFSADEIVTTAQYVEIADVADDSFSMLPFTPSKPNGEDTIVTLSTDNRPKSGKTYTDLPSPKNCKSDGGYISEEILHKVANSSNFEDHGSRMQNRDVSGKTTNGEHISSDNEDIFSKMGTYRITRKYHLGLSSSDAEVDYRRGRNLRERK